MELRRRLREDTRMLVRDDASGPMQVAPSRVVAEPGPEREHFILGCLREVFDPGKSLGKAFKIVRHHRDLSLLQHHFREPNPVRGTVGTPG